MADLPWRSQARAAPGRDYVALLTYLPLRSVWRIPLLLVHTARIRRQLRASPGVIGYSMRARLEALRFWTLSVWEDEAALQAFVMALPHAAVMKTLAPHMGATRFARWTVKGSGLPLLWDDALKHDDPAGLR